jgi:hypothetical protein
VRRVGGFGHRLLPPATCRLVERELRERLLLLGDGAGGGGGGLVGITSLADGADQLFATAVLAMGGSLEVVLPTPRYQDLLPPGDLPAFERLLARASAVDHLDFVEATSEAHMAAGQLLVDRSELVIAVWDGEPARGLGGTGDIVAYARSSGVPVEVIWPAGSRR